LLVAALVKEPDRAKRRNRFITTLIMVPTLLGVLFFIYVGKLMTPDFDFFHYVSLFFLYSFAVALLCIFVYGVLGIKLRIERDPLEHAMEAASSGTHLLNHAIKNEIGKIAISAENLKRSDIGRDASSQQFLRMIADSSEHLLAMADRLHDRTKRIALHPRPCRIDRLAEETIESCRSRLEGRRIAVRTSFVVRPTLLCDPVHLREAIGNVLSNAIEALPETGGRIGVSIERIRRGGVSLAVDDNGAGIPSERLGRVFDPFYSTKNGRNNFGLGLSYVYNVMRESGGSVELFSKEGEGTRVVLHFPRAAIVADERSRS